MLPYIGFFFEQWYFIIIYALIAYLIFRFIYRNAITNIFDPLHVQLAIYISFYSSILIIPFVAPSPVDITKYLIISSLLILFLIVSSVISVKNTVFIGQFIRTSNNIIFIFTLIIFVIQILNFFINTIGGHIPLLSGGSSTKIMIGRESRLLHWISYSFSFMPILLLVLVNDKRVQFLSILLIVMQLISTVLGASKAAIFVPVFMYANIIFLLYIKGKHIKNIYYYGIPIILSLVVLITFFTVYLSYLNTIGVTGDQYNIFASIFNRLAGGFDQLIYYLLNDSAKISFFGGESGLSLVELFTASFLKVLIPFYDPKYNTVNEYFFDIYLNFSNYQMAQLPNSNLLMDAVFTNGAILAFPIIAFFAFITFLLRKYLLSKRGLILRDLIVYQYVVMTPFVILLDGQLAFMRMLLALSIYLVFNTLINIFVFRKKGIYKFY